jgi:orotidine-5'-phosphate decarboxylase
MSHYIARLHAAIQTKRTPVVVGLDPRWEDLPQSVLAAHASLADELQAKADAFEEFCLRVIDVVAPLVPAVKPQAAFFEECGPAGAACLARVIRRAREAGLIVICDAKRGDIGSTAEAYARAYLAGSDVDAAPWGADALTVNPYLGRDTLLPFVELAAARGAAIYVLVRTSNPGARTFQDRQSENQPLYHHVAKLVEELAASTCHGEPFGAVGAVVGATYPQELIELRKVMPHAALLVPGYGSQGAGAQDVAGAFTANGLGAVINSSRGIIFAYKRKPFVEKFAPENWEQAVEAATREMIADLAQHTPAGNLQ